MIRIIAPLALFLVAFPAMAGTLFIESPESAPRAIVEAELAKTDEERARGLMGRKNLLKNSGMIFVFNPPQPGIKMWMKNTLIPLDVLYADRSGRIFHIEEDMKPNDLTPRGPGEGTPPTAFALEIPGGSVALQGIMVGDKIVPSDPDWLK